jgi:hypothetical protein
MALSSCEKSPTVLFEDKMFVLSFKSVALILEMLKKSRSVMQINVIL